MESENKIIIRFRDTPTMKKKLQTEAEKKKYPTYSFFLRELIRKFYKQMPKRD